MDAAKTMPLGQSRAVIRRGADALMPSAEAEGIRRVTESAACDYSLLEEPLTTVSVVRPALVMHEAVICATVCLMTPLEVAVFDA